MMTFGRRLHNGWLFITHGATLLMRNKKLFVYKLLTYVLKIVVIAAPLMVLTRYLGGKEHAEYVASTTHPVLFAGLSFAALLISLLLKYYLDVALAHHTLQLMDQKNGSIAHSLHIPKTKMRELLLFTSGWFAIDVTGKFIGSLPLFLITSAIVMFVTFYFIPALASEELSFFESLKLSFKLSQKTIVEIAVSTVILLGTAKLLNAGTFVLVRYSSNNYLAYVLTLVAMALEMCITTLFIVVRAVAFYRVYKKPIEHLDAQPFEQL